MVRHETRVASERRIGSLFRMLQCWKFTVDFRGELEVRIQMGWTPSATAEPGSDRIGGTALSFKERSP